MVKKLKTGILLLLSFAVLLATTGLTVFKMTCFKNGKTYHSFQAFSSCCKIKHEQSAVSNKCCAFGKADFKVKLLQQNDPVAFHADCLPLIDASRNTLFLRYFSHVIPTNHYASPPDPGGRTLLAFQSILLI